MNERLIFLDLAHNMSTTVVSQSNITKGGFKIFLTYATLDINHRKIGQKISLYENKFASLFK